MNFKKKLFSFLLLCSFVSFSEAKSLNLFRLLDRAVEIHYTKVDLKEGEVFPKEIKIQDRVYPLFKTKEEAYDYVKNMSLKSDVTIVYVASKVEKETEILNVEK